MRLLLLIIIVLAVAGYFLGWMNFKSADNPDKVDIGVTLDKSRVRDDLNKGRERTRELGREINDEAREFGRKIDRATRPDPVVPFRPAPLPPLPAPMPPLEKSKPTLHI